MTLWGVTDVIDKYAAFQSTLLIHLGVGSDKNQGCCDEGSKFSIEAGCSEPKLMPLAGLLRLVDYAVCNNPPDNTLITASPK